MRFLVLIFTLFMFCTNLLSKVDNNKFFELQKYQLKSEILFMDILDNYVDTDTLYSKTIDLEHRNNFKIFWRQFFVLNQKLQEQYSNLYELDNKSFEDEISMLYCFLLSYEQTIKFLEITIGKEHYESLLDEEDPYYGIDDNSFSQLKNTIIHKYFFIYMRPSHKKIMKKIIESDYLSSDIKLELISKNNFIKIKRKELGERYFLKNFADLVTDVQNDTLKPLKKKTLKKVSRIRLSKRKGGMITQAYCDSLAEIMHPGDIIFERKEWYMSNIGLPGFWKHTALFIGSEEQLLEWSKDKNINEHFKTKIKNYKNFPAYLKKKYPKAYKAFLRKDGIRPVRLIEAIAEGVIFQSLNESIGASDYTAVLRPNLDKVSKAQAIEKAFSYYMYKYDFDFDFRSDRELVCSEMIFKSYETKNGKKGLNLPLKNVIGKVTLPPNYIIQKWANNKLNNQLNFVLFLDANEDENKLFFNSEKSLRNSYKRPKWSYNPEKFDPSFRLKTESSSLLLRENYYHMPINLSFVMGKGMSNNFAKSRKVIDYCQINILAGATDKLHGVQLGVVWNHVNESMIGFQCSWLANSVVENVYGAQVAFLANAATADMFGFQYSWLINYTADATYGFQASGLSNFTENLYGAQISLITNSVLRKSRGIQIAPLNISDDQFGIQLGIVNTAVDIFGFQVGIVNGAMKVKEGCQIGLVNISETTNGYPIGILNLAKDGVINFSTYLNEREYLGLRMNSGSEKFKSIIFSESNFSKNKISLGFGIQRRVFQNKIFDNHLEFLLSQNITNDKTELSPIFSVNNLLGFSIMKYFNMMISISYNYQRTSQKPKDLDFLQTYCYDGKYENYWYGGMIGFELKLTDIFKVNYELDKLNLMRFVK